MARSPVEHLDVHVGPGGGGEALEEIGHQLRLQITDVPGAHAGRHDRVGAPAEIDSRDGQRFIFALPVAASAAR